MVRCHTDENNIEVEETQVHNLENQVSGPHETSLLELRQEMHDLKKECMDVVNKKTYKILNMLRVHMQSTSLPDDRSVFRQVNIVILDYILGYCTAPPNFVTQLYMATYSSQTNVPRTIHGHGEASTSRQRPHSKATGANVVPLGPIRDPEPRIKPRPEVEMPANNQLFEEQIYGNQ